jgi:preprotein translocase subunit SecA
VAPRETAIEKVERALGIDNLYDPRHVQLVNHLIQALKAESLYQLDVDYVVQEGEVKIVDEFTGRIMEGRRWSEGLHQAVEAKEGVAIKEEFVTLATITLQNYFRLYEKLAGMTGTAKTEEKEFQEIYGLSVVEIPTNVPVVRIDENDFIFKTREAKYLAVIEDIKERHAAGQPVLVGTISVEVSEYLSKLLQREGIPHNVLNAKQHEREAEIIKDAGGLGAVTIATNMAGRGVDIKLGEGVREAGGLYVLGTERHEARRIDNQLRGRSGRQGDPGESRFYLSAEDELVRLFAGDRIYRIIDRFKLPDNEPMEASILTRQIEGAQKKVEEQNFVSRKNVLKYDDVLNTQRQVIYEQRRSVLEGEDLGELVHEWIDEVVERIVREHTEGDYADAWDIDGLLSTMSALYETEIRPEELDVRRMSVEDLVAEFTDDAHDAYEAREEEIGPDPEHPDEPLMRRIERYFLLQVVDTRWREHLDAMDYLREGIHLRAFAQKDPLAEYRSEGHAMFADLSATIREEVVRLLFHVEVQRQEVADEVGAADDLGDDWDDLDPSTRSADTDGVGANLHYEHESVAGSEAIAAASSPADAAPSGPAPARATATATRVVREVDPMFAGVGRNEPCPCGSGRKFKRCHGA